MSLPGWVSVLQIGQWTSIPNTNLSGLVPSPAPPGSPSARYDSWNGLCLKRSGSVLMGGALGGHNDYAGNEVVALALNTAMPTWTMLRTSSAAADMLVDSQFYSDLRPADTHTYYAQQFLNSRNKMVIMPSPGLGPDSFGGIPYPTEPWPYATYNSGTGIWTSKSDRTFCFDVASGDWNIPDFVGLYLGGGDFTAALTVKHPYTDDVYIARNGADGWYRLSASTLTYTKLSTQTETNYCDAAIDPRRSRMLIVGDYDGVTAPRVRDLSGNPISVTFPGLGANALKFGTNGPNGANYGYYPRVIYDEVNDQFLAVINDNANGLIKVLSIHPTTWFVANYSTTGTTPAARINGVLGAVQYVPEIGGLALANDYTGNVKFLRLSLYGTDIGGTFIPTLQDEKNTYTSMGLTWGAIEPNYPVDSGYTYTGPVDLHGETEGDDLWTYLMQYIRTGQAGYLSRATALANYFKSSQFVTDMTVNNPSWSSDQFGWGGDHLYGWGLLAWYEYGGATDSAALARAQLIASKIAYLWGPDTDFHALPNHAGLAYGLRHAGRQIHLLVRLIQVAGNVSLPNDNGSGAIPAQTLLNQIIDTVIASPYWDITYGMYFIGEATTDEGTVGNTGGYAAGVRAQSTFQIPVFCDALYRYYRAYKDSTDSATITRVATIRARLISIGNWVYAYGMDTTYNYPSSYIGVYTQAVTWGGKARTAGEQFQSYNDTYPTVNFWDTNYTIGLVNPLVIAYKLTGTAALLTKAKAVLERHNGGKYDGNTSNPFLPEDRYAVLHHFVDTIANSALTPNGFTETYLQYNKGELQYAYWLFENGGSPFTEVASSPPPPVVPILGGPGPTRPQGRMGSPRMGGRSWRR